MTVTVETTRFEFAHGRKPRGVGDWAFDVKSRDGSTRTVWALRNQSFTAACKQVRRENREAVEIQAAP